MKEQQSSVYFLVDSINNRFKTGKADNVNNRFGAFSYAQQNLNESYEVICTSSSCALKIERLLHISLFLYSIDPTDIGNVDGRTEWFRLDGLDQAVKTINALIEDKHPMILGIHKGLQQKIFNQSKIIPSKVKKTDPWIEYKQRGAADALDSIQKHISDIGLKIFNKRSNEYIDLYFDFEKKDIRETIGEFSHFLASGHQTVFDKNDNKYYARVELSLSTGSRNYEHLNDVLSFMNTHMKEIKS